MKIYNIIKILIDDRREGSQGRNKRVTQINKLLGLTKIYTTAVYDTGKNKYYVEYTRNQFWYDDQPITLGTIIDKLGWWHVQLWTLVGTKGRVGLSSSMVRGRISKNNIYSWLYGQAKVYDKIFTNKM